MTPHQVTSKIVAPVVTAPAEALARRLAERTRTDLTFWDFAQVHGRTGGHGYFQYPAMMVPELQRALLEDLMAADPAVRTIYDPFMGSGTVMLESMYLGLDFIGSDINPFAILLSHVKAHPPSRSSARLSGEGVVQAAKAARAATLHDFAFRDKWFTYEVAIGLSRLRRAIQGVDDQEMRRFLWICLAETVRFVSNSRPSTFKLHLYPADELGSRKPDPIVQFSAVVKANVEHIGTHEAAITRPLGTATLLRSTVSDPFPADAQLADALMTSPPYGDNHTTVPYGQYSYLPLQWIDSADLVGDCDGSMYETPGRLDTLSLGGRRYAPRPIPRHLADEVPSLVEWLGSRSKQNAATQKVVTFVDDYRTALRAASARVRGGGFVFLTLGERRVDGADVPLVRFTQQLLEASGHSYVDRIERLLPSRKRIANKNAAGETMIRETVLVMRVEGSADHG